MHLNHLQPASTVPVVEIQWLAALVPYESPSSNSRSKEPGPAPSLVAFSSDSAKSEQSRLDKAIDLLLDNWTTFNQPAGPRITDITSQASQSFKSHSHSTAKTASQKDSSAVKQSARLPKAPINTDDTPNRISEDSNHGKHQLPRTSPSPFGRWAFFPDQRPRNSSRAIRRSSQSPTESDKDSASSKKSKVNVNGKIQIVSSKS